MTVRAVFGVRSEGMVALTHSLEGLSLDIVQVEGRGNNSKSNHDAEVNGSGTALYRRVNPCIVEKGGLSTTASSPKMLSVTNLTSKRPRSAQVNQRRLKVGVLEERCDGQTDSAGAHVK